MAMRVRNRLPQDDPYADSKTELQWRKEGRALNSTAIGKIMWNNRFCEADSIYYREDETRPATPEDVAEWREERNARARAMYRKRREAELAEEAREKARIERLYARLRRHIGVDPISVVCLDCETTGLSSKDEILQLSIVNGAGEVLFNEYIRPQKVTEWPEAERIHGISPDMVANKPTIEVYREQISEIMAKAGLIIGYNVFFDLDFLRHAGIERPKSIPVFDVMTEFAEIYGEWSDYFHDYRWQKLYVCADYFGYEGSSFHDSLEDVRATLYCYYAMTSYEA